jgi:hypothetical protein
MLALPKSKFFSLEKMGYEEKSSPNVVLRMAALIVRLVLPFGLWKSFAVPGVFISILPELMANDP